jgi:antitoxin MazE
MPTATLNKWGNSQGIIIPKSACSLIGINIGDELNLEVTKNRIEITPVKQTYSRTKKLTAEDVFAEWNGQYTLPADLPQGCGNECDWGEPCGKEVW